MVYDKFLVSLAAMEDYDAETNEARMVEAIAAPLADAQATGLLNPRLTAHDILVVCRMLASHIAMERVSDPAQAFQRRLDLMMQGLGRARNGPDDVVNPPAGPAPVSLAARNTGRLPCIQPTK